VGMLKEEESDWIVVGTETETETESKRQGKETKGKKERDGGNVMLVVDICIY
jgi:hypothetical protein